MKIRIKFAKTGVMKFVGHLDVMRYFQKAIRRAELPMHNAVTKMMPSITQMKSIRALQANPNSLNTTMINTVAATKLILSFR